MIPLAVSTAPDWVSSVFPSAVVFGATVVAVWVGAGPAVAMIRRQEQRFDVVLRGRLLMDITPRQATVLSGLAVVVCGMIGYGALSGPLGGLVGLAGGIALPYLVLKSLTRRRLARLEEQLVGGIQILASGVRAGLNLVGAMELIARDGPVPLRQEFTHLLGEYEYGIPLDDAMDNCSARVGSSDYSLLFSALQTHRQRGGDLGRTLDRIAESIREIQRLENRIISLTAQGRATARWLGALPLVVLGILYLIVDPQGVRLLFTDDIGKLILVGIVGLNVVGFLWIRKIMAIDI